MNINENILKALQGIDGCTVLLSDMIGEDFCHDELPGGKFFMPDAVINAYSAEAVAEIMKICSENNIPVTVRGAGTGQVGGSVPIKGGVVLSLKEMNRILGFDEESRILHVQSGVMLQDVKAEAEKHALRYPPDPGELTSTIGGNAATNAGGPCALKYGRTGRYIESAAVVLADGSIKTLSGDSLSALIGSEGTLAVITELKLRLIEKPGANALLLLPFMDTEAAINAARTIIDSDLEPACAEYMDTDIIEFSGKVTGNPVFPVEMDGDRVAATLMLDIEGSDDDDVMEKMEALAEMAEELECLDILVGDTPSMKRDFWNAHTAFHTSMESGAKSAYEANVDVSAENMAEMISFAKDYASSRGLTALIHAHVGSGGMHIHAASRLSRSESGAAAEEFLNAVYNKCIELGGHVAGEYGIGYVKKDFVSPEQRSSFISDKAVFDPKGILNPGKVAE